MINFIYIINMPTSTNILPLTATGFFNKTLPIIYSHELVTEYLESSTWFSFPRNSDTFYIESIVIPIKINVFKIKNFEIKIGGSTIWKIPFSLLLNNVKIIDEKYYIPFNNDLLGKYNNDALFEIKNKFEIPLAALTYHQVECKLNSDEKFDYELLIENIFYAANERTKLHELQDEFLINQYQTFHITGTDNIIIPDHISTCIYVETSSPLIRYELVLANMVYMKMDDNMISYYDSLISKKKIWTNKHSLTLLFTLKDILPNELIKMIENYVTNSYKYLYKFPIGVDEDSLTGTINFSRLENVKINLMTQDGTNEGDVYIKNKNVLMINHGMGGVKFSA